MSNLMRVLLSGLFIIMAGRAAQSVTIQISQTPIDEVPLIFLSGKFSAGDADEFQKSTDHFMKAKIVFNSPGGSVITAIKIGEFIRRKQFDTLVPSDGLCASACALSWLGGHRRFIMEGAKLGFHAAYTVDGDVTETSSVGNALVGAYLTRLGLSYPAVAYVTKAAPDAMTWLDPNAARLNKIVVDFLPRGVMPSDSLTAAPRPKITYGYGWNEERCESLSSAAKASKSNYGLRLYMLHLKGNCGRTDLEPVIKELDAEIRIPLPPGFDTGLTGLSDQQILAAKKRIDPKDQMGTSLLYMTINYRRYEYDLVHLRSDSAHKIAYGILQLYKAVYSQYVNLMEVAILANGLDAVAQSVIAAYIKVPLGRGLRIEKSPDNKLAYIYIDGAGKEQLMHISTPDELLMAASTASLDYDTLMLVAAGKCTLEGC